MSGHNALPRFLYFGIGDRKGAALDGSGAQGHRNLSDNPPESKPGRPVAGLEAGGGAAGMLTNLMNKAVLINKAV